MSVTHDQQSTAKLTVTIFIIIIINRPQAELTAVRGLTTATLCYMDSINGH